MDHITVKVQCVIRCTNPACFRLQKREYVKINELPHPTVIGKCKGYWIARDGDRLILPSPTL